MSKEKIYKEVDIHRRIWMGENLNVDTFRNGDPIPELKTTEEWLAAIENEQPGWCYYENDPANGEKYGRLYNKYAMKDKRGLAPNGWRIPQDDDWTSLEALLGASATSLMRKKADWSDDGKGSNRSGFTALPGGYRDPEGDFLEIGKRACWWSTSACSPSAFWIREIPCRWPHESTSKMGRRISRESTGGDKGLSVRCVKAFDSKYSEYGEIKIEGSIIQLYYSSSKFDEFDAKDSVSSAEWSGDTLIVRYSDGKGRKYWCPTIYSKM